MPANINKAYQPTTTGAIQSLGAPGGVAFVRYAIQVKGVGAAATTWSVTLEGSLDNVNWTTILTHANADVDGTTKWDGGGKPCMFVRANVGTLTLAPATALAVTVVATS